MVLPAGICLSFLYSTLGYLNQCAGILHKFGAEENCSLPHSMYAQPVRGIQYQFTRIIAEVRFAGATLLQYIVFGGCFCVT